MSKHEKWSVWQTCDRLGRPLKSRGSLIAWWTLMRDAKAYVKRLGKLPGAAEYIIIKGGALP